jgi:hypothetical protein
MSTPAAEIIALSARRPAHSVSVRFVVKVCHESPTVITARFWVTVIVVHLDLSSYIFAWPGLAPLPSLFFYPSPLAWSRGPLPFPAAVLPPPTSRSYFRRPLGRQPAIPARRLVPLDHAQLRLTDHGTRLAHLAGPSLHHLGRRELARKNITLPLTISMLRPL